MKLDSTISAVITGGASGMGRATAELLIAQGVKVALFDYNAERGEQTAQEIGALFCRVDVTSEEQVVAGFEKARAANGQERIMINCAGGGVGAAKTAARDRTSGEIKPYPMDNFDKTIQMNLVGTFRCASKSAAGMMSLPPLEGGDERGIIINTASVAAQDGQIGQAAYTAAKAGIVGVTLVIARDLGSEGIRCNTILPGVMDTPMMAAAPPDMRAGFIKHVQAPKRFGLAEEYASLAGELIRNPYINGESIRLDGGLRMPPRN